MKLEAKRVLITAAGQGIGRASAVMFAEEGAQVMAIDVNASALEETARIARHRGRELRTRHLDIADGQAVAGLIASGEVFDVLFNCAGFVHDGNILDCSEEEWHFSWDINVSSMYRLIRAVLPGMLAQGRGVIVNMASAASSVKVVPNRFIYGTTKAAVVGLTKSVAADFVAHGIRCNAICPGAVETAQVEFGAADHPRRQSVDVAQVRAAYGGRIGKTDEIAALALYLASDESALTTGAIHVIDGGWSN